jgi:hypothetical protein
MPKRYHLNRPDLAQTVAKMIEWLFNGPSFSDCGCTLRLIHKAGCDKILPLLTVKASHFLPEMVILCLRSRLRMI